MMKIILEYLSREDNIEKLDDLFSYTKINFSKLDLIKYLRTKNYSLLFKKSRQIQSY